MRWQELVGELPPERVDEAANEVRRCGDYFVKFPGLACGPGDDPPELQLVVEYLAYRLYAAFGVRVPAAYLVHDGDRLGLATRRVHGPSVGSYLRSRGLDLEQVGDLEAAGDVYRGFFVDVLLANWDVVGLTGDNLILGPDGIYRIDPGGSLTFRAQGDRKGAAFGAVPGELTTMKDPRVGTAGRVFGRMSAGDEARAAAVFRGVAWPTLQALLQEVRAEAHAAARELTGRDRPALVRAIDREFGEITPRFERRFGVVLQQLPGATAGSR